MGIQKINVPARFDPETVALIERDAAAHRMTPGKYIRESMIEWLKLRVLGAVQLIDGTVQLLDAFAQQEQKNLCAPREQREQSLQISFPSAVESPETLLGKKPPVRVQVKVGANRGREFRGVSRRMAANEAWFGTSLIIHSTPLNERAA